MLVQIVVVTSVTELSIMPVFAVIHPASSLPARALADASRLATISTPIIYAGVMRPDIVARDEATHLAQRDLLTLVSQRPFLAEHLQPCSEARDGWGPAPPGCSSFR
jgi:hypothetical protein